MRHLLVCVVASVVLAAACTSGVTPTTPSDAGLPTATGSTTSSSTTVSTAPESWDGPTGSLSAWDGRRALLTVPLDHDHPDGPTIDVPVWRRTATDPGSRIGVLLVNPGGPGAPVKALVDEAQSIYTRRLRASFDIVALAPRGTFGDTAVTCFEDLGALVASVDWSPDAPGELEAIEAALQAKVDECERTDGAVLPHVSTMDTVHDMAALARALGEEPISYFGSSYGTVLGAAFAASYPELVRAAVLDAAYHPYADPVEQAVVARRALDAFLARLFDECDTSSECPIEDGPLEAFSRVSRTADAEPFDDDSSLIPVNQGAFSQVVLFSEARYGGSPQPLLTAVAAADAGDGVPLQQLYASVSGLFAALAPGHAISCMDYRYRGESPYPDDMLDVVREAGPIYWEIFAPESDEEVGDVALGLCERWPAGPDLLPSPSAPVGAGPILVVTATGDPVTPQGSAELLAEELGAPTLLVDDTRHGSYEPLSADGARRCATEHIDAFLVDLEVPEDGTVCQAP